MTARDPLAAAAQEDHPWYSVLAAFGVALTLAMVVIMSSDGAPFVDPWKSLWELKLKFNVRPSYNWEILLRAAGCVVGAWVICYWVSQLAGKQLDDEPRGTRSKAIKLGGYAALCVAYAYTAVLLLVCALGWLLFAFKVTVFVFGWLIASTMVFAPIAVCALERILRRTPLGRKSRILFSVAVGIVPVSSCFVGATFAMDSLDAGQQKYGQSVNESRRHPIPMVVQACGKASANIVCAVTLYPGEWQDYELIGDWAVEDAPATNNTPKSRLEWQPSSDSDRQFALVKVESRKDVTIEIHVPVSTACKPTGLAVTKDIHFFAAQGRVLGEQHDAPKQVRLRIDNAELGFVKMMERACASKGSP
ncbi:6TM ABC transporter family protein [Cupriavidus numazuensis]|uniref:hypothetical protein n=1 Tax=Cupriavidus numazuensis TaxID=221992 RepID=UPI001BA91A38|nr:hypothetical protein [Cupriavidus numazuensis]